MIRLNFIATGGRFVDSWDTENVPRVGDEVRTRDWEIRPVKRVVWCEEGCTVHLGMPEDDS
jgi:hypothetical protein